MSRRSLDEDDPEELRPSDSGIGGAVARWGLLAWLGRGVVVPVVAVAAVAVVLVGLLVVLGIGATNVANDVHYQCDSAIGPNPAASATVTPTTHSASEPADVSTTPSANPYASLEPEDGDSAWQVSCFSALTYAPYQEPPVGTTNDGFATECAVRVAVGHVGRHEAQGELVRSVVYEASAASLTGRCEEPLPAAESSADAVAPAVVLPPASTCPDSRTLMLMPDTVLAQGVCGQRVDLKAVSAGDLVFWDHRDGGPMRVGIAIGPTELVTSDDVTGVVVSQAIPQVADIRVKRVLPLA